MGKQHDLGDARAEAIDEQIERLWPSAIELLQKVVRINSINPMFPGVARDDVIGGEAQVGEAFGAFLKAFDFEIETVAPDVERANTVARRKGAGGGRSLLLNGHVDTVAPFHPDRWVNRNPWSGTIVNGNLYGLGSTDMKGGLAAATLAAAAVSAAGITLQGELQLHYVVGEETMSHEFGTSAVLRAGFGADAAIVVEPTGYPDPLSITNVSAGNFNLQIDVKGYGTHSGNRASSIRAGGEGSAVGVTAVEKGIIVVQALQQLEQEWGTSKFHPAFPAGFFSLAPAVFHADVGVPSVGYLAETATLGYLVWYPPNEDPEAIRAEIESHVQRAAQNDPWLRHNPPTFRWESHWPVFDTPTNHPLALQMIADRGAVLGPVQPGKPGTHSFNAVCDASFIEAAGIPSLAFGPGDLRHAHAVDEHVRLEEVKQCARILARTITEWCGVS